MAVSPRRHKSSIQCTNSCGLVMQLLERVRILDLSRLLPGPYCTRLLADMGAEVIKVEEPGRGDYLRGLPPFVNGVSVPFELLNRGKRSLVLNLEMEQGQEILARLASKADVFFESFRPGTTKKLGCDFDRIRKANPTIVYCSLTAFGQTGPYRDMPGHDINVLALSGFLGLNGREEPVVPALQVGDLAGGMLAALTIMSALYARQQRKEAQYIDASMLDALLSWMSIPLGLHSDGNAKMLAGALPFYRLYKTLDSGFLAVGAIEPQFWEGLCNLIDRPDLIPDQYSPEPRRSEVVDSIQSALATKTVDQWFRIMHERQLPCTPLLTLDQVLKDAQARERQMMVQGDQTALSHTTYIGNPCKVSGLDKINIVQSPKLGQHSIELLQEGGYSKPDIKGFVEAGIVEHSS